ncbi:MAG TPA: phage portal protein [Lachnospiraceae bacterium]|nr:phage portal protein [Lachnospiraceae bacterium]
MFITDWFRGLFNKDGTLSLDCYIGGVAGSVFYKELALQSSVSLIANSITRSEFLTYENGKEVRKINHYMLNVEANQNTSASVFWRNVVKNIIYKGECLVIMQDNKLYVADSFDKKEKVFYENVYSNIEINGYKLEESYSESKVLHFEWSNPDAKKLIDGLNAEYAKLIEISSRSYKRSKGKKGTLEIPADYPQTEDAQNDLQDLMDKRFKKYFEAEGDALIPLTDNLKYTERGSDKASKDTEGGREIRNFIDDIFDFTGIALRIPPQLLKGNVQDTSNAVNDFLTFCLNPFVKFITDELNRKMYGIKHYTQNTYVKCDTRNVKVVNLKDIANALDILTRIGAYTIDDSLKALGMEPLNTDWSRIRFMTKNYQPITEMLKGGD